MTLLSECPFSDFIRLYTSGTSSVSLHVVLSSTPHDDQNGTVLGPCATPRSVLTADSTVVPRSVPNSEPRLLPSSILNLELSAAHILEPMGAPSPVPISEPILLT